MDLLSRDIRYWKNVQSKLRLQPFLNAVESSAIPIVIADPFEDDTPLVFVNAAFLRITGYAEHEVLGRNCRFLQGPETQPAHRRALNQALSTPATISQDILNYRKDGTTFWNELHMAPMYDEDGALLYFVATQIDITDRVNRTADLEAALAARTEELLAQAEQTHHFAQEMTHRVRNSLALIQAMMRMQLSGLGDASAREVLTGVMSRIGAIVEIQRVIEHSAVGMTVRLDEILNGVCGHLNELSQVSVTAAIDPIEIREALLTPVALIVSELVANAQKHAFATGAAGTVHVAALGRSDDNAVRLSIRDTGKGLPLGFNPRASLGFGMKMIVRQIDHLGANLDIVHHDNGTEFIITIPAGLPDSISLTPP